MHRTDNADGKRACDSAGGWAGWGGAALGSRTCVRGAGARSPAEGTACPSWPLLEATGGEVLTRVVQLRGRTGTFTQVPQSVVEPGGHAHVPTRLLLFKHSLSFPTVHGFSRQECWSGSPFPSPVDHSFSEVSTMTRPSWVARGLAHSFIDVWV